MTEHPFYRCLHPLLILLLLLPAAAAAQDANIRLPIDELEERLLVTPFELIDFRGARFEGDRTQLATLVFEGDEEPMGVKWAVAPRGGHAVNNEPRYEIAAYEIQKLFLDEEEYVVPPTVARVVPLDWHRGFEPSVRQTFGGAESVLVVLQYWLWNINPDGYDFWNPERFERDTVYARHMANMNVFTYLIRHNDANVGNFLKSMADDNPRVFSVDNGMAFGNIESDRGVEWRRLRVPAIPSATVERLRAIDPDELDRFGVVVQMEVRDGQLVIVEPGESLGRHRPVRTRDGVIQLGLTAREINGVKQRLRQLLRDVERGRIQTF